MLAMEVLSDGFQEKNDLFIVKDVNRFPMTISPPTSDRVKVWLLSVSMAWKISRNSWEAEKDEKWDISISIHLIREVIHGVEIRFLFFLDFSWEVSVRTDWVLGPKVNTI